MRIEYLHASEYGNGAHGRGGVQQADGHQRRHVNVHHIREAKPKELPSADLYLFGSPRAVRQADPRHAPVPGEGGAARGHEIAILTTEAAAHPDISGRVPSDEQMARWTRVHLAMNDILRRKGLVEVARGRIRVTGVKEPLEEG